MPEQPELLLKTHLFRVERVMQTTSDGVERPREVVRHPGAVCIVPILDHDQPSAQRVCQPSAQRVCQPSAQRVCLIRNERVAVGQKLIELPAGTLEPGEDPRDTAARELSEETGYRAGRIEPLAEFHTSPGILDERMYLFLATDLTAGDRDLQPGEEIENLVVPLSEAMAMVRRGEIVDAKTLVGLLWYQAMR